VKTQARCAFPGHGAPESDWSSPTAVSIVEEITVSGYPSGPDNGAINESYTFTVGSGRSNAGHAVEFRFDWNDGTFSDWFFSDSADHAYTTAGIYDLAYQARCAQHTTEVSDWSGTHDIDITGAPESVNTPDRPSHYLPGLVIVGEATQVSVSGSFSNHGHPVEYQFEYGDGDTSAWTAGTIWGGVYQLTLYHTYTSIGSFDVTCKARCATHTAVESAVSESHTIDVIENIEAPAVPTGPATGTTGANLTFATTGATSSEGHTLEYRYEYRRGTYSVIHQSDWSTSLTDDYVFTQAGSYRVRVQARCVTDTGAVSSYSGFLDVTITD